MIKYSYNSFRQYYLDIKSIDLDNFNKFIANNILMNALKFNNILPFVIAVAVAGFSIIIQQHIYVFLPQSSITSFASYMVFTGAISLLIIVIYPLIIIFTLNYFGQRVRNTLRSMFLPLKILILMAIFYACISLLTGRWLTIWSRLYIMLLWMGLYFVLINLYLSYLHNNNILKITKFKFIFLLCFTAIIAKPYMFIFVYTSEMINYTSVNPLIYLNSTNCKLISSPILAENKPENLSINDPQAITSDPNGCMVRWGLVRYGFASDYVLVFKKNIHPVKKRNKDYNVYVRLNCFAGNCYSDDDKYVNVNGDLTADLIDRNRKYRTQW